MGGGGSAPAAPNLQQEYTGEITGKADTAPLVYGSEATYDPLYASLNLTDLQNTLMGTPAGTQTVPTITQQPGYVNSQYGTFSTDPSALPNYTGNNWTATSRPVVTMTTEKTAATPGLVGLMGQLNTAANTQAEQSQQSQTGATVANMAKYGAPGVSAIMNADPGETGLMNSLVNQATAGVNAGYGLTPQQMTLAQQSARQAQAAQGFGYGPSDAYAEALGVSQYAQNLYNQRMATGQNVAGQQYSQYTAPAMNLASQTPQNYAAPYFSNGYNVSSNVGPKLFGSDINAQDTYNTAYNAQMSQYNSAQNNAAALTGSGISAAAGLGTAGLMAGALLA